MTATRKGKRVRWALRGRVVSPGEDLLHQRAKREGITRTPRQRKAPELPMSASQRQVYELLGSDLSKPGDLAQRLGRSRDGVVASLYALADRGLVVRVPRKGWRRA